MIKAALSAKYEAALSDFYVGYQTLLNDVPGLFPCIGGLLSELKERNIRVCLIFTRPSGRDQPRNVFYSVEALRERLIHHNTQRNSPD